MWARRCTERLPTPVKDSRNRPWTLSHWSASHPRPSARSVSSAEEVMKDPRFCVFCVPSVSFQSVFGAVWLSLGKCILEPFTPTPRRLGTLGQPLRAMFSRKTVSRMHPTSNERGLHSRSRIRSPISGCELWI
jgi:hypothetical protein